MKSKRIDVGTVTKIKNLDNGKIWQVEIVPVVTSYIPSWDKASDVSNNYKKVTTSTASVEDNRISDESALGKAIIGKHIGEHFSYVAPDKKVRRGVVLDILD